MKKTLLFIVFAFFFIISANSQNVWMNEIHYDNVGTDEGEFIEIVLENAGSYNLADFTVTLYNGNGGASYNTKTLDEYTAGAGSGDFTILYYNYPSNGIQNGEGDGVAISYQGSLIDGQFLSYEGTLTAVDGPAAGETSTDIGVSEIGAEIGTSLQLAGTGSQYDEFSWQESAPETKGELNNEQTFGGYTPDPEPSNYPTDFEANAVGLSIPVNWTDATGTQLPAAYLILGQKGTSGNFQAPVDGIAVPDDMDWSDDKVAVNVAYGIETYNFSGLVSGQAYEFTIYPYSNAGENIDYKTDGAPPTTSVVVSEINIINEENFNDGTLGSWSEYSVVGPQKWVHDSYGGNGYAKMNGYDGGAVENEDWLLSPQLSLPTDVFITFGFISAMNYEALPLQLFVSVDYTTGDPNDVEWTEITDQAVWSAGSWVWTESGDIDLATFGGMVITLGFKYTSSTDGAATWEIDDLIVYSEEGVSVAENKTEQLRFYPNPATNVVNLNSLQSGALRITNLTGQVVYQSEITTGTISIDISTLNRGLYIIQFIGNGNKLVTGKLMVK